MQGIGTGTVHIAPGAICRMKYPQGSVVNVEFGSGRFGLAVGYIPTKYIRYR